MFKSHPTRPYFLMANMIDCLSIPICLFYSTDLALHTTKILSDSRWTIWIIGWKKAGKQNHRYCLLFPIFFFFLVKSGTCITHNAVLLLTVCVFYFLLVLCWATSLFFLTPHFISFSNMSPETPLTLPQITSPEGIPGSTKGFKQRFHICTNPQNL